MAHSAAIAKRVAEVESAIALSKEMIAQYHEVIAHMDAHPGDLNLPFHHLTDGEKRRIELGANPRSVVFSAMVTERHNVETWNAWLKAVESYEAKSQALQFSSIGGAR
jgi:hypothetical protein